MAFSPDGARLACGSASGVVAVFDVASGKFLHALEGHAMPVRTLDFSPDGKTLYTGCDDGHVHAYDAQHRNLTAAFPGHKSWVMGVDASPDGRALVSCGADGAVKLWDLAQRTCAQTLSDQTAGLWGVRFGPGGEGWRRLARIRASRSTTTRREKKNERVTGTPERAGMAMDRRMDRRMRRGRAGRATSATAHRMMMVRQVSVRHAHQNRDVVWCVRSR